MKTANAWLLAILLTLPLTTACHRDEELEPTDGQEVSAADMSAEELGRLGAELDREPERAAEILQDKGIDPEELEAAIRDVASDVDASREYARAFAQASDAG